MKKLFLSALVFAGVLASAGAWADAECQAGSTWGNKPGCGAEGNAVVPQWPDRPYQNTPNQGWNQGWNWGARPFAPFGLQQRVYRRHPARRHGTEHTARNAQWWAEHHRS